MAGSRQFDTSKIVERYERRIAMTMLTDFVLMGHDNVGSFALSSDKTTLFAVALGGWLDGIRDIFNLHAITRLAVPELLRASHIKPWAECDSDAERLDVFNGILLTPHLDATFDRGFITVADDGAVIVADSLERDARRVLGLDQPLCVNGLTDGHRRFLPWHRERVFR